MSQAPGSERLVGKEQKQIKDKMEEVSGIRLKTENSPERGFQYRERGKRLIQEMPQSQRTAARQ